MKPLPRLRPDGLETPEVGAWAEEKYQLVLCYASIVAKSMAKKWPCLVYLDLFAGAGRARIRGSQQIIDASPLLVLGISGGFTKYIFCELQHANAEALRKRVAAAAPDKDMVVIEGDTNASVGAILGHIPVGSLTFCFVDPFTLGQIQFATIEQLAQARRVDFLVLLATGMDPVRNEPLYTRPDHSRVSDAVGHDEWRQRWPQPRIGFGDFVADEFGRSMATLGYHYNGLASTEEIDNGRNAPIYRLAFFSKHPLGDDFWKKCRQSADPNRRLF